MTQDILRSPVSRPRGPAEPLPCLRRASPHADAISIAEAKVAESPRIAKTGCQAVALHSSAPILSRSESLVVADTEIAKSIGVILFGRPLEPVDCASRRSRDALAIAVAQREIVLSGLVAPPRRLFIEPHGPGSTPRHALSEAVARSKVEERPSMPLRRSAPPPNDCLAPAAWPVPAKSKTVAHSKLGIRIAREREPSKHGGRFHRLFVSLQCFEAARTPNAAASPITCATIRGQSRPVRA